MTLKSFGAFFGSKIIYQSSNESSASIHICIVPSRYNLAYCRGLSTARAFNAHSELGAVFNPSSPLHNQSKTQSVRTSSFPPTVNFYFLKLVLQTSTCTRFQHFNLSACQIIRIKNYLFIIVLYI